MERDVGYAGIEKEIGLAGVQHATKHLPVSSLDGHLPLDGHAHHGLQAMDSIEILRVIDPGAGLDDVRGKGWVDAVLVQKLASGGGGDFGQVELKRGFGYGSEWEMGFLVHLEKPPDGAFHQGLVPVNGEESIFPDHLGDIPPAVTGIALGKDKFFAIPDS